MNRSFAHSLKASVGFSLAILWGAQGASDAADFYQGKTIQVIAPYSAGGTYDAMARLIAQHMGRHIPGKPEMIVQNRAGGGGMIGARAAYTASPDGLTITHMASTLALRQLFGLVQDVDFTKWAFLGSAGGAHYILLVRTSVPHANHVDFQKADRPLRVGALGPGSLITETAQLAEKLAGYNLRIVPGYKGLNDIALATRQGELDAYPAAVDTILVNPITREMMEEGFIRIAVTYGGGTPQEEYASAVAEAPKLRDAITDPSDREIYDAFVGLLRITRPFMATPGTPQDRVAILREAFWKTLHDDDFVADAEKRGFTLDPVDHEGAAGVIDSLFQMPPETQKRFKEVLG